VTVTVLQGFCGSSVGIISLTHQLCFCLMSLLFPTLLPCGLCLYGLCCFGCSTRKTVQARPLLRVPLGLQTFSSVCNTKLFSQEQFHSGSSGCFLLIFKTNRKLVLVPFWTFLLSNLWRRRPLCPHLLSMVKHCLGSHLCAWVCVCVYVCGGMGFELKASHLPDKYSTAWAILSAPWLSSWLWWFALL
jgi:hypothetical protein